ncbi:chaperonin 10-like protein [Exophiala viscosa]|uniref:Chaperonin 10-like protein n=1 Tax=Exophiala viscosa TaxID=2486360 RepID=A0AAN6DQK8_9EURO|nr:chaperonin 10-like protein [Exophiala viscosa]
MTATMRAAVIQNPGKDFTIDIIEKPKPQPANDEILVRLQMTGICHSDLSLMMQEWTGFRTQMQTVGHEGAGVVEAIGKDVTGWHIGDKAGVKPISYVCHTCESCIKGREQHCPEARFTGITMEGTYQQYIAVPAIYATRIPEGVDLDQAAPVMCSGTTSYAALRKSGIRAGDWVVVLGGGGGLGHFAVQIAKAMGARVIAVDSGAAKKDLCMSLGAFEFIDIASSTDPVERTMAITGGGAHAVIVASAHPASYASAPNFLRIGGTVVCVAMPPTNKANVGGDPNDLIAKNITIKATMVGTLGDTAEVLDLCAQGLVKPVVTTYPLDQLPHAIQLLKDGKVVGRAVVDLWA